jgi:hypothetical protein
MVRACVKASGCHVDVQLVEYGSLSYLVARLAATEGQESGFRVAAVGYPNASPGRGFGGRFGSVGFVWECGAILRAAKR